MSEIQIIKRDGNRDTLDLEKLHKVVFYACENINGVSASEVEIKSSLQFYSGITSSEIQAVSYTHLTLPTKRIV